MIAWTFALFLGSVSTFGFVHSIRRDEGTRANMIEWMLSAGIGVLVGAAAFSLLR
jgi:hypothetical protein